MSCTVTTVPTWPTTFSDELRVMAQDPAIVRHPNGLSARAVFIGCDANELPIPDDIDINHNLARYFSRLWAF
jgi:hypothetical protein